MKLPGFRVDGLRTRLILVFITIVVIVAGTIGGAVSLLARSWVYINAQDLATAKFHDEMTTVKGFQIASLASVNADHIFSEDITLMAGNDVLQVGSIDPHTISEAFLDEIGTAEVVSFERLDSERILLGYPVTLFDTTFGNGARGGITTVEAVTVRPLLGVQDKLDQLVRVVVLTLAVGVLASGLLGFWIATSLVRPLRRLDDAAARAADGDLSVRLPEHGVAELARVTSTFNTMVARTANVITDLERSEEQSRRFVADVSHELRTPLAALVPVSEILREEVPNLPPDSATAARIASHEIAKLTRLVEDLIEMSRHDSAQARLVLDDTDLVEATRHTLATRGWSETVALIAPDSLKVEIDARRIDVVIANLVGNALRHGAPPRSVELFGEPGSTVIRVLDHGPGIAPEHRQSVFYRFFKTDTARGRSDGSGLGLSLAMENVHLHGGTIEVDSTGSVTVFTVRLPC
ncbi:two-component system sensor histidine kinase MtrB [Rhodococcus sp. 27YEA15]|uniref:sensor histidine kinase n=1 Tax=Rhodococcus sp. 27YEA15 TaxID=3156259 RepID=UPI003C7D5E9C